MHPRRQHFHRLHGKLLVHARFGLRFFQTPASPLCVTRHSTLEHFGSSLPLPHDHLTNPPSPRSPLGGLGGGKRGLRGLEEPRRRAEIGSSASDATHAPVTVSLSLLPPSAPSAVLVLARSRSLIIAPARCVRCMQPQLAVWGVPVNRLVRKRSDAGSLVVSRACRSSSEWLKNIKHKKKHMYVTTCPARGSKRGGVSM